MKHVNVTLKQFKQYEISISLPENDDRQTKTFRQVTQLNQG